MSKKVFRVLSTVAMALIVLFAFSITPEAAKKNKKGAKTSPPPMQVSAQGFFYSGHQYLVDGTNQISQHDHDTILLEGMTYASQVVDYIGVYLQLQKWNGSYWEDVGYGVGDNTTNDHTFYTHDYHHNVETGYYYRLQTTHWVHENGTYEEGVQTGGHILMK